jgi:hypothetical protein
VTGEDFRVDGSEKVQRGNFGSANQSQSKSCGRRRFNFYSGVMLACDLGF